MMNQHVSGNQNQQRQPDADKAGGQSDDEGLGIEYLRNVSFGGTHCAEDADFLLPLQNTDIGDYTDHNGGNDEGNGDEGNQHIADDIDDIRYRGHERADGIGIGDGLVVLAFGFHAVIVGLQDLRHVFFALEIPGIDADGTGGFKVHIIQGTQVALIGIALGQP